jgi:hypothetical protein
MGLPVDKIVLDPYRLTEKEKVSDSAENGFVDYAYPRTNPALGILEFKVEGNSEHCIIPSGTYLKMELEITGKASRDPVPANSTTRSEVALGSGGDNPPKVFPVNNIFHSIIESVEVFLEDQPITKSDKHYPYISYIQSLSNYDNHELHTNFQLCGWSKDTQGQLESLDKTSNKGLEHRKDLFHGTTALKGEFIGKLFSPLFMQNKVLPPQVGFRIVIRKANDAFALMHERGEFQIKITNAVLMVQKVSVNPTLKESYNRLMDEDDPSQYYLPTPAVNYYTIESGATQFMRDDLFLGRLPRKVVIMMVETSAYHGDAQKNPFNFQHFNVSEIGLYKDGMPYPYPPTKMDFSAHVYSEAYHNLMKSNRTSYTNKAITIDMADFAKGYTLFSFDMSPDQLGSINPASLLKISSNIRLEMKFKEALPKNVTLLVYYETVNLMEIQKDRRVTVHF